METVGDDVEELDKETPSSNNTRGTTQEDNSVALPSGPFKRARQYEIWKDLGKHEMIDNQCKVRFLHCKELLKILKSGSTTHYNRHLDKCPQKRIKLRQQTLINFLPSDSSARSPSSSFVSALHDGNFDALKFREGIAHWIVMHEKAFSVVEEEGFNLMLKRGIP
ncbi:hypothetical protein HRI_004916300 [Hibiscus trionum]|uniref:BED-type domain-containing protein n=1 Tax=Hibiscus trionum TaxID=183268 RepID=A0A9W7JBS3_HIBTR|nr:hypothetical protein HRI_004916300 [Hibiscus trionum]